MAAKIPLAGQVDAEWGLLARAAGGNGDAFTALVEQHQARLVALCTRWLGDREAARDAAQEVFLKAFRHAGRAVPRGQFYTWLYRIAVNESLSMLRRNGHEEPLDDEIDVAGPEGDDPERRAGDAELSARIRSVVMGMATNDRTVLMLRHFSELSYLEIGQILDLDEKTVKSRLFEARQRLRSLLPDLRGHSR